ncbi:hypothetical protein F1559_001395 [Cyanidiococcus yangmingshanensis]|uniref:Uncharacterized protein n=1 Tax=Cyanidiococcus yangmingshanensis TaxID=2690220 RepID=A0A7J7ICU3_9RHOD|nr:hypothetical protein F1559_001395 [Cyanidiococcus yangmingshanensis]
MHLSNQWDRVLTYSGLTSWCLAQEGTDPTDRTLFMRIFFGGIAIVFFGILFTTITGRMVSKVDQDPSTRALLDDILDTPRERRATGKRRMSPSETTAPDPNRKPE